HLNAQRDAHFERFRAHFLHQAHCEFPSTSLGLCPTNRAWTNSVRKYAISLRRSPIWNILMQSALSITSRHNGLLRIVQRDVTNRRLAIADCISGTSPAFLCKATQWINSHTRASGEKVSRKTGTRLTSSHADSKTRPTSSES